MEDDKEKIFKLQVVNSDDGKDTKGDFLKLVLWIRESRPLPVMKLELTEANKDIVLYELTNIVYNPQLQPSLLKPSFPDDVEIVDPEKKPE